MNSREKTEGRSPAIALAAVFALSFICLDALPVKLEAQLALTNGLVAYYPFNGSADDQFGANNGVVHGATLTTNRFGLPNSAYSFNGSNAYIETFYPLRDMTTATFSLWFNAKTVHPVSDNMTLLCDSDTVGGNDCTVQFRDFGGGGSGIFITASKNTTSSTSVTITNGAGTFTEKITNNWLHFVWVMTSTNQGIFINGSLKINAAKYGNDVGYHGAGFFIGAGDFWPTNTGFFSGILDDIRVYNRALSSSEVSQLYQYETQSPGLASVSSALRLSTSNLVAGGSYQIQASADLTNWTNYGAPFIALSTNSPQYVDPIGQQAFFRIISDP